MSCYFRYIKDVFAEAGIEVTDKNKKAVDQAIHRMVRVQYKKCMPDCWGEVKKLLQSDSGRRSFIARLKKAVRDSGCSGP